ncbi:hypothetical protein GJ744_011148 [Endocarpon pusillum]|uniref:Carrier domain-containing protein n=1 Tax=Endocarpon pusillum TaxID=364733 RepID=A0A8H7E2F2_9EURO|nr:hypothetical protein GJ744_011148 [Endocarpon pusillum]
MNLCAEQVHIQAADILTDPIKFLHLLHEHRVEYTFGPNFFLARLSEAIASSAPQGLNLSHLRAFISGVESNTVTTCATLSQQLRRYGVKEEVVRPGFGMTETCAGSIYSKMCPSYDQDRHLEFASLGSPIPGIKMRVANNQAIQTAAGEVGDLHVTGPIVFKEYFNNSEATKAAFSPDGWFITGDRAYLDENGYLNLVGRSTDTIITNGVKFSSTEIQTAIEEEKISGVAASFTVVFPYRAPQSHTESICVIYSPEYVENDAKARFSATEAISKVVSLTTSTKPAEILPLPKSMLEKTSLGKISRTKVKAAFSRGAYNPHQTENSAALCDYRFSITIPPSTPTETRLAQILISLLSLPASSSIPANTSIFTLGITSITLLTLKSQIETQLTHRPIPLSLLLRSPTIKDISSALSSLNPAPPNYDPIVPLNTIPLPPYRSLQRSPSSSSTPAQATSSSSST